MERLTVDELARNAGITTRNVRAYQERGLLPPPTRVGRVGYYDERHLARLSIIGELLWHHVWEPFVAAGMPADELPRITEIIERLRPVAAMAVLPALATAMEKQVKAAVGTELTQASTGSKGTDRAAS